MTALLTLRELSPGDVLIEATTPAVSRESLQAYALASGDSNPLHLDPEFAREAGFDDVIVHGMFGMARLGCLLGEQLPVESIRGFSARFAAIIPVGQALHCRAMLESRNAESATLALELSLPDGRVATRGTATIVLGVGG